MKTVTLYDVRLEGNSYIFGTLSLVNGQIVGTLTRPNNKGDQRVMVSLLKDKIGWYNRPGGKVIGITAQSHPEAFLDNLHVEYANCSSFWASKPREVSSAVPISHAGSNASPAMSEPTLSPTLTTLAQHYSPLEKRWLMSLVKEWGEQKVLAQWESLQVQLELARSLM